ncbi:MAG TPA: ABC transporter ATP-binding protein [Actinomycetota bacterium]|nr:ABC transporter ATP-binding protein [Actinomycetota bacterium]
MGAAIEVQDVSKVFKLYHEQYHTLKERMIFLRRAKRFEEFHALRNVSFEIEEGTTFGLIGANGSGKSTMLKLMAGILRPTTGELRVRGRIGALLEVGAGFHPDLTGRQNVYLNGSILGFSKREIDAKFDDIVSFAEMEAFIDNPVRNYSSGMYIRLGFAVAVHMDPDILLIDEVIAVGDEAFQKKCMTRMRQFQDEGKTILLVTHAVDGVRDLCSQACLLSKGTVAAFGDPSEVIRAYRNKVSVGHDGTKIDHLSAVEIGEVTVTDPRGQRQEYFVAGEPMAVHADLEVNTAVKEPVFSVNIYDSAGQHVFGTNTQLRPPLRTSMDLATGRSRLRIDFDNVPMREGYFSLLIGIHSPDGKTVYAAVDGSVRFEMRSPGHEPGRLTMACRFSMEAPAEQARRATG